MVFKKVVLASCLAAIAPVAAMAVDLLDEGTLSGVSGQDGVQIALNLDVTTNAVVHDPDGFGAVPTFSGYSYAGAVVVQGLTITAISGPANDPSGIIIRIDAGDASGPIDTPLLNVTVQLPAITTIHTGTLMVGNSRREEGGRGSDGNVVIMRDAVIQLGPTVARLQLGDPTQGHLLEMSGSVGSGVNIANLAIHDAVKGGDFGAANVQVSDSGGTSLTANAVVDVTSQGLLVTVNQLGGPTGMDIRLTRQYLGSPAVGYIGDLEMQGLNMAGTQVSITGK